MREREGSIRGFLAARRGQLVLLAVVLGSFAAGLGLAAFAPGPAHAVKDALVSSSRDVVSADSPRVPDISRRVVSIDLGLDEESRAHGFLHGEGMAPGDVVRGTAVLDTTGAIPAEAFSFSFRLDSTFSAPEGAPRLADVIHIRSIRYQGEELIGGSPRDVRAEIDADPARGNGDGKLSLVELATGVGGLPAPAPRSEGGSTFEVAVAMDPAVGGDGTQFAGQLLDVTFVFTLDELPPVTPPTAPTPPPPVRVPSAPIGLAARGVGDHIELSWSTPSDAGTSPIQGYHVRMGTAGDQLATTATVGGLTWATGPLPPGATRFFSVSAFSAAGEGSTGGVVSASVPLVLRSTLALSPAQPDGSGGWYKTSPTVTLSVEPAGAEAVVSIDGAPFAVVTSPIAVSDGTHDIEHFARASGQESEHGRATVRVDTQPPRLSDLVVTGDLVPGGTLHVSIQAEDAGAGLASVVARIGGASTALVAHSPTHTGELPAPSPGVHALDVVARDAGGNERSMSRSITIANAAPTVVTPPTPGTPLEQSGEPGSGGTPLESSGGAPGGGSGGGVPGATSAPGVILVRPDNSSVDPYGVSGPVRVKLSAVPAANASRTYIFLVTPNGTEVVLAEGTTEYDWDTDSWEDGFYRIEQRERRPDGSYETVATTTVLVRHPNITPVGAAVSVLAGAAIAVVASGAGGTIGSTIVGRVFNVLDVSKQFVEEYGADKMKDKTKGFGLFQRKERKHMPSLLAGALAAAVLAMFFTLAGTEGWNWREYVALLPIIGGAAVAFYFVAYAGETLLARATGAASEFRFLLSGAITLILSTLIFRAPFGYAGFVDKDEIGDDTALPQRRLAALRVLGVAGLILATMPAFLLVGYYWRFDFAEWGMMAAMILLASSTLPFRPLPGSEVWAWKKWLAVALSAFSLLLYFGFTLGWLPMTWFIGLGLAGGLGYAWALWRLKKDSAGLVGEKPSEVLE